MKRMLTAALLLLSPALFAQENFVTYPETLYPPGCATTIEYENEDAQGPTDEISRGIVGLLDLSDGVNSTVRIVLIRQGCSEPGRSIIKVQIEVVGGGSAPVPNLVALIGEEQYFLRLSREPSSNSEFNAGLLLLTGEIYEFFLDNPAWVDREIILANGGSMMTPDQYNGEFELEIVDFLDFKAVKTTIPAYDDSLMRDSLPLNGRLSGTWVSEGAADQGVLIAFEELPDGEQIMFFSWYTFGADGELLWLTSSAAYQIGDSSVDFDLVLVTDGQFLGDQPANRQTIGSASLTAVNCNDLEFTFDLSALDLGSQTVHLKRLFSLETAGFACRDQATREATISD